MQFVPFERAIEVNGQTVYAVFDGFAAFKSIAADILTNEGIGELTANRGFKVDAQGWYPQDAWLRAFERIAKKLGDPVLFSIGKKIPENAIFPPWVTDIDSAIRSIDVAYHLNHRRNGKVMFDTESKEMTEGIGHYGYARTADKNEIVSVCENPYPCHFDRGILTTMALRFQPGAQVRHDDSKPCRNKGADSCTYVVQW
ncbi:MAG: hypothetical protein HOW73_27635 [Polyangiaceae bacterium]|nr:hypothetical protein [Polyangiaceae bacterium]